MVGKKLDTGKSPLLRGVLSYFPNALAAVGNVSAYGAQKYNLDYSDRNWARVEGGLGRYGDALARHTTRHAAGEGHDPESHLLHIAHAAWNALAVLELILATEPLIEEPANELAVGCVPWNQQPTPHAENCKCHQCWVNNPASHASNCVCIQCRSNECQTGAIRNANSNR